MRMYLRSDIERVHYAGSPAAATLGPCSEKLKEMGMQRAEVCRGGGWCI
jgi:hypothetical protein